MDTCVCPSVHAWTVRSYKTPLLWLVFCTIGHFVAISLMCSHTKPMATQEKRHPNLWTKVATRLRLCVRTYGRSHSKLDSHTGKIHPHLWKKVATCHRFVGPSVRPSVCLSVTYLAETSSVICFDLLG